MEAKSQDSSRKASSGASSEPGPAQGQAKAQVQARAAAAPKAREAPPLSTRQRGAAAEELALAYLLGQGLRLVQRNFRTFGRGGGEIDLIMRARDGTLVFVEVRQRRSASHGGALASVGALKQRRLLFAASCYLQRLADWPPCRFDVVAVHGSGAQAQIDWRAAAFNADGV